MAGIGQSGITGRLTRAFPRLAAFRTYLHDILNWSRPAEPVHLVGPLHFVGTRSLGCWLFVTDQGHILLNSGTGRSARLIKAAITAAGHDWRDIRLLLIGHAHKDHAGAMASLRAETGAQLAVMAGDAPAMRDGGRSDFHLGRNPLSWFRAAPVDRILRDGDSVELADVRMTAHSTAGHTPGATTWTVTLVDAARSFRIALIDGINVNPGYDLIRNRRYPAIAGDYAKSFARLRQLQPDIWLTHHGWMNDFDRLRAGAQQRGVEGWINGPEYSGWIAARQAAFEAELNRQQAA